MIFEPLNPLFIKNLYTPILCPFRVPNKFGSNPLYLRFDYILHEKIKHKCKKEIKSKGELL